MVPVYSNVTFNISLSTTSTCCCETSSNCNFQLRIYDGNKWRTDLTHPFEDHCSCDGGFWNCSIAIMYVTANASFCAGFAPAGGKHFFKPFDVAVQGKLLSI